jgi:uncharacterized cupredoxin-like copper-binding protein
MVRPTHIKSTFAATGIALTAGITGLQQGTAAHASSPAQAKAVTVKVTLRDFTVTMSRRQLPAGKTIRFMISNRGKAMHEAVLEPFGADDKALSVRGKKYEADDIAPGTTRTVTWTVPQAGKYQLACHMPGHFQMGMKTTFRVTGS